MRLHFVQNTGAIAADSAADPSDVTAGKIVAFNAATGAELDTTSALAVDSFYFVLGDADQPVISPVIHASDIVAAYVKDYVAPAKKLVTVTGIPAGPSGGDVYTVKVLNLKADSEPFARKSYETVVPASQADEDSIYALVAANKADANRFVDFGCNKIDTHDLSGTSGTANVVIADGDKSYTYLATWATSDAVTIDNFISTHAADILSRFGITVTDGTTDLIFTGGVGTGDFTVTTTNLTGDLAGTPSVTEATSLLIQSVDYADNFQVFLNDTTDGSGIAGATATVTTAWAEGSGSGAQIRAEEAANMGRFSNFYRETPQPLEVDPVASASLNYDKVVVIVKTNQDGQSPVRANESFEVHLCQATGVTGDFQTFLGAYI